MAQKGENEAGKDEEEKENNTKKSAEMEGPQKISNSVTKPISIGTVVSNKIPSQ